MQKISFFIHFLFVQNAEIIKLNLQNKLNKNSFEVANQTFMHVIQTKMLILTFTMLPKFTMQKLTKSRFYAIIYAFLAVLRTFSVCV